MVEGSGRAVWARVQSLEFGFMGLGYSRVTGFVGFMFGILGLSHSRCQVLQRTHGICGSE